jgi:plastocyanin
MTPQEGALENPIRARPSLDPLRRGRTFVLVAISVSALMLSACGEGESSAAATQDDANVPTVVIRDLAFEPETLTVKAGDAVTWRWDDGAIAHDVEGDGFRSEVMSEGTFSQRFDEPGTYDYVCTLHPNMTATIEVTS